MADAFISSIAVNVVERVGLFLIQEIELAANLKSDLEEFRNTLSSIKAGILDSEERPEKRYQLSDQWLKRLKNVCNDAEDMLDEYEYETSRQQVVNYDGFKTKVRKVLSVFNIPKFSINMGHKLQEIRKRLDRIAADKVNFDLAGPVEVRPGMDRDRETHSRVPASEVFIGRGDDIGKIIQLLMCVREDESVSIIPIVGIGGLGKTTLAKLVYNDKRVEEHFPMKIWVYVSPDFNVHKVKKDIINSAAHTNCGDHLALDEIETLLENTLRDKLFLLILDDVWRVSVSREKWVEVKNSLMVGASGSKIIVTTRDHDVASIVSTIHTTAHQLEDLPHDKCLFLFVNCAFRKGEEKDHPRLLKIGDEIVKKCGGNPLAVRTLGNQLYSERDVSVWLKVRDSAIWDLQQGKEGIAAALELSYKYLPSYLRRCFSFCSVFPKGYNINSLELIRLWMALGLLTSLNENLDLEYIGQQYIKELSSRSLFQNVEEQGSVLTFKMHDLIHDLASSVAQKASHKIYTISDRYVSISGKLPSSKVRSSLPTQNNIRAIIFTIGGATTESFAKACIPRFKFLRVLDLRDSPFEELPSSIGELKFLKYLNLYNSSIKKLPKSICNLLNLQTLELSNCWKLEALPTDIWNLKNLRCFYITTKQECFPGEGIGCLESLRFLEIIKCCNLKSFGEGMQRLTSLQTLLIRDCSSLESLPQSMKDLTNLETLFIYNCEKLKLMEWKEEIQGLGLSLRSSYIAGLPQLLALPHWLQAAANTLEHLYIGDCCNLAKLPEWLQNHMSLQKLVIEDCPKLSTLPEGMRRLLAQGKVEIKNCPKLRTTGEDWPKNAHVAKITTLDEETKISTLDEITPLDEETSNG